MSEQTQYIAYFFRWVSAIEPADPTIKKVELEFPVTEIEEIDRAIALSRRNKKSCNK